LATDMLEKPFKGL